ncbi:hypothetical protein TrCOL_g4596 [Triparma columacea]|uniref:Chlorophyll a-b binding protein, chloroplastic n=1 Tax=Triparma columacea TaxID=722753 RepID=A0A9W7L3N0_9STRA|nr:hypothetical protein TrCOL_g4596 [Triparma columacea]
MKFALFSMLLASAAAFQAPMSPKVSSTQVSETVADLEALAEKANPIVKFYDPMNLSESDFYGWGSEGTIGWLRQSEIKHGRIAMFAFVGYIVHANGIHWPWPMQTDGTGWPTGNSAPEIWDNMSTAAKWQIFVVISMLEVWDECGGGVVPHYTKGRKPGQYPSFEVLRANIGHPLFDLYDPFNLSKNMSQEKKDKRLVAEINNGRLAMLGIFGFLSEGKIEGSVPVLKGIIPHYGGEVMQPFEGQFSYFS